MPLSGTRSSDRVYARLRQEIVDGSLAPGSPLAEVEQAERLGVSRTPLRAALSRLESDGLAAKRNLKGLFVTEVSLEHVRELFEIREALEVKTARLAAVRRDPATFVALGDQIRRSGEQLAVDPSRKAFFEQTARMDAAIDEAAGNDYLVAALHGVRLHMARIRQLSRDNAERLRSATQEHLMIIDAIVEGSETMAAYATELHLHRSLASILETAPATSPESRTRAHTSPTGRN